MKSVKKDRRRHIRYRVNKNVLSVGEDILGEVLDISNCGIGGQCLASADNPLDEINEIEILNCDIGSSVEGIRCKLVRSRGKNISDAVTSTMVVNFGLEFSRLTEIQRKKLHQFIKDNTLREATAFF